MTRKEFRKQTADNIRQVADFGNNGAIHTAVKLIRNAIKKGDMDEVEKWLKHIEECCVLASSTNTRNYHAMEMMYHFALAVGEKYDPMYLRLVSMGLAQMPNPLTRYRTSTN